MRKNKILARKFAEIFIAKNSMRNLIKIMEIYDPTQHNHYKDAL